MPSPSWRQQLLSMVGLCVDQICQNPILFRLFLSEKTDHIRVEFTNLYLCPRLLHLGFSNGLNMVDLWVWKVCQNPILLRLLFCEKTELKILKSLPPSTPPSFGQPRLQKHCPCLPVLFPSNKFCYLGGTKIDLATFLHNRSSEFVRQAKSLL
jgi:hypothetical protein